LATLRRFLRHDVRTPLTVILGHSQMIAERLVPESRLPQSFDAMRRQAEKLNTAIEGFCGEAAAAEEVLWVACCDADEPAVRAALSGICFFVGSQVECQWLREPNEALLVIVEGEVERVRRAAEALVAESRRAPRV
jgi:signal transduction histidine kinase